MHIHHPAMAARWDREYGRKVVHKAKPKRKERKRG